MKKPKQHAEQWLRQAVHDLEVAQSHLQQEWYSDCCYMSEQTAQKAMKAYLYAQGERYVTEHAIASMVKRAMSYEAAFQSLREQAAVLDQYYIPTRYPDALAEPAVPFESYTRQQASQALAFAQQILEFVKQRMPGMNKAVG